MRKAIIWLVLGVMAGLVVVAAVVVTRPYTLHGSVIQSPSVAPDISLPQADGGAYHLTDQKGRVVVVFFGFTHCMDVCPTTLAQMKTVRERLGADADKLQVVFITVDPDRDTPAKTAQYAAGFDPSFVGLSGGEDQLKPVWEGYGVYRKLDKKDPADMNYMVEHSSQVYVIDREGKLRLTYAYGSPTDPIVQDIRYLVR